MEEQNSRLRKIRTYPTKKDVCQHRAYSRASGRASNSSFKHLHQEEQERDYYFVDKAILEKYGIKQCAVVLNRIKPLKVHYGKRFFEELAEDTYINRKNNVVDLTTVYKKAKLSQFSSLSQEAFECKISKCINKIHHREKLIRKRIEMIAAEEKRLEEKKQRHERKIFYDRNNFVIVNDENLEKKYQALRNRNYPMVLIERNEQADLLGREFAKLKGIEGKQKKIERENSWNQHPNNQDCREEFFEVGGIENTVDMEHSKLEGENSLNKLSYYRDYREYDQNFEVDESENESCQYVNENTDTDSRAEETLSNHGPEEQLNSEIYLHNRMSKLSLKECNAFPNSVVDVKAIHIGKQQQSIQHLEVDERENVSDQNESISTDTDSRAEATLSNHGTEVILNLENYLHTRRPKLSLKECNAFPSSVADVKASHIGKQQQSLQYLEVDERENVSDQNINRVMSTDTDSRAEATLSNHGPEEPNLENNLHTRRSKLSLKEGNTIQNPDDNVKASHIGKQQQSIQHLEVDERENVSDQNESISTDTDSRAEATLSNHGTEDILNLENYLHTRRPKLSLKEWNAFPSSVADVKASHIGKQQQSLQYLEVDERENVSDQNINRAMSTDTDSRAEATLSNHGPEEPNLENNLHTRRSKLSLKEGNTIQNPDDNVKASHIGKQQQSIQHLEVDERENVSDQNESISTDTDSRAEATLSNHGTEDILNLENYLHTRRPKLSLKECNAFPSSVADVKASHIGKQQQSIQHLEVDERENVSDQNINRAMSTDSDSRAEATLSNHGPEEPNLENNFHTRRSKLSLKEGNTIQNPDDNVKASHIGKQQQSIQHLEVDERENVSDQNESISTDTDSRAEATLSNHGTEDILNLENYLHTRRPKLSLKECNAFPSSVADVKASHIIKQQQSLQYLEVDERENVSDQNINRAMSTDTDSRAEATLSNHGPDEPNLENNLHTRRSKLSLKEGNTIQNPDDNVKASHIGKQQLILDKLQDSETAVLINHEDAPDCKNFEPCEDLQMLQSQNYPVAGPSLELEESFYEPLPSSQLEELTDGWLIFDIEAEVFITREDAPYLMNSEPCEEDFQMLQSQNHPFSSSNLESEQHFYGPLASELESITDGRWPEVPLHPLERTVVKDCAKSLVAAESDGACSHPQGARGSERTDTAIAYSERTSECNTVSHGRESPSSTELFDDGSERKKHLDSK